MTSEITLKGRRKIIVCSQIVLSKRAWFWHVCLLGGHMLKEQICRVVSVYLSADSFTHALKDPLFLYSAFLMFFFIIVKFYSVASVATQKGEFS